MCQRSDLFGDPLKLPDRDRRLVCRLPSKSTKIDAVKKQHADMQTLVSEPYVLVISRDGCLTLNASVVAELDAGTEVATRPISEWFADIALCPVGEEASQELIDRIQSVAKLKQLSSFVLTAVIVDDDL